MHNNFFINQYLYRSHLGSRVKSSTFIGLNMSWGEGQLAASMKWRSRDKMKPTQSSQKQLFGFHFLRFLGNDISDNSDMALHVRLDSKSAPTVKFSKDEEQQKLLCEVPILKTRPASVVQIESFSKSSFQNNIQLNVESNPRFYWLHFTWLFDQSRKLAPLSQTIRCKTTQLPTFSRASGCLVGFYFDLSLAFKGIMIMLQVLVTKGRDQRVVPEERPALGEWTLTITQISEKGDLAEEFCFKKQ